MAYDPCTVASHVLLEALGVQPDSQEPFRTEAGQSTMVGCRYRAPGSPPQFVIELNMNFRTPAEFRADTTYRSGADTDINGRPSTVYNALNINNCSVAMPPQVGSALAKYLYLYLAADRPPGTLDTCPQSKALARIIEPLLPPA